jgi:hypothetical protein
MGKEVADHDNRRGNAQGGEKHSPGSSPDFGFSASAKGRPTAVNDSENQEQQQHHQAGVVHSAA